MYERFTDRARKVMQLANQEAQRFNHEWVDTEHLLLGLIKEGSGVAANVLKNLDVDLRKIRLEVEKHVTDGAESVTMGKLPQTPGAKRVIEFTMEEARNLNHNYNGTEHLLLGMLREGNGIAAQVLISLGLKCEDVRKEVVSLLGPDESELASTHSGTRFPLRQIVWESQQVSSAPHLAPAEGRDHPLSSLPDDVDYIQHLADEFATYCAMRESQAPGATPDEERPPGLQELDEEIERFIREKEEAVNNTDYELAASLREQADKLKEKKKEIIIQWREQAQQEPKEPEATPIEPVELSEFSRLHLKLFRARAAMKKNSLVEAAALADEVDEEVRRIVGTRISELAGEFVERLEFVSETIDPEKVKACRAELEALATNDSRGLQERASLLNDLQEDIGRLVSDRPKLVVKANVFKHGVRDVMAFGDDETVGSLQERIKTKHSVHIQEYLYGIHAKTIPMRQVRVQIFSDSPDRANSETELEAELALAEIPDRDTEGVTWYPEWRKADSSVYRKELQG